MNAEKTCKKVERCFRPSNHGGRCAVVDGPYADKQVAK